MKIGDLFVKIGANTKGFTQGIGKAKKQTSGFSSAMKRVGGVIAGAFAVTSIINFGRKAIGVIKGFEQANATLAATLGKNINQVEELTKQARDLGKSTEFTASQVSSLQNELAKLGFSQKEIKASARGILDLSSATGNDLANSAMIAGSALRAFNLDASEMSRVTSVLAVATTKSALSMSDYASGLSTIAPVAKAFGFTIEDTVALMGKLRDAGFDASSSATATRNILLNLADANGKLTKALGGPVKSFDEMIPALVKLRTSGVDLNSTLQLTDKRSVAAFNQFLQGAENALVLRDSLIDVKDELTKMVNTKTDTVEGALNRIKSAWEGLLLTSGGGTDWLKNDLDNWAKLILVWQDGQIPGWKKFWASVRRSAMNEYYDQIIKRQEDDAAAQERVNSTTLAELEKQYDNYVQQFIKMTIHGNDEAAKHYEGLADDVRKLIKEMKSSIEELPGEGLAKPFSTLDDRINETKNTIKELEAQLINGYIIDVDKIVETTGKIDTLKSSLESLVEIQTRLNNSQRSAAPSMISGIGQSTFTGGESYFGGEDGLGDMSSFLAANAERMKKTMDAMLEDGRAFSAEFNTVMSQGAADAIQTFAASIGEGLATGNWDDFGKDILSAVGSFMQQLGALFISFGTYLLMAQTGASTLNPWLMIAAGAGLVAAGAAISALSAKGMKGGGASYASSGGGGYNAPSAVAALSGNVVFELEGTKLKGAIDNTNRRNSLIR